MSFQYPDGFFAPFVIVNNTITHNQYIIEETGTSSMHSNLFLAYFDVLRDSNVVTIILMCEADSVMKKCHSFFLMVDILRTGILFGQSESKIHQKEYEGNVFTSLSL